MLLKVVLVLQVSMIFFLRSEVITASMAKPGCQEICGNITVPYPFGIGAGCYQDKSFEVICRDSVINGFHISEEGMIISHISLDYVRAHNIIALNTLGAESPPSKNYNLNQQFSVSQTQNKFVGIGCDIFAYITDSGSKNYTSGCAALCDNTSTSVEVSSISCLGIGCCQTTISKDLTSFSLGTVSINTLNRSWNSKSFTLAFIVANDVSDFNFRFLSLSDFNFSMSRDMDVIFVPVIFNWVIGNTSCQEAHEREICECGQNSDCINSTEGLGYRCRCWQGYQGNPYLPNGCQDIDECQHPSNNICQKGAQCVNTPGNYFCTCPNGYHRDAYTPVGNCILDPRRLQSAAIVSLGAAIATAVLILIAFCVRLYRELEKRKRKTTKQKFFKRNGGLLLQQQISSSKSSLIKTKLFLTEEMEKATNDFKESLVLGKGGHGTVYKGMLPDGTIVAIKKSNIVGEDQVGRFINEVFILSHINHRNIVKLLGCCLEYEVPLLVYEYVHNGTLSHHLHDEGYFSTIPWENRLRIAVEVAEALAYLHSYASTAIFHRDIKSTNILLNENYKAVVSDFGLSRSVPLGKTHLTTLVGGTFGYLDPEYFRSGQFTDKSDVYAFGVVLAELLTGRKAVCSNDSDEGLVNHFQSSMKQNQLFEILESLVLNEGHKEDILAVAKVAKRCLKLNAKKRPSMKEVAAELDRQRITQEKLLLS